MEVFKRHSFEDMKNNLQTFLAPEEAAQEGARAPDAPRRRLAPPVGRPAALRRLVEPVEHHV